MIIINDDRFHFLPLTPLHLAMSFECIPKYEMYVSCSGPIRDTFYTRLNQCMYQSMKENKEQIGNC